MSKLFIIHLVADQLKKFQLNSHLSDAQKYDDSFIYFNLKFVINFQGNFIENNNGDGKKRCQQCIR